VAGLGDRAVGDALDPARDRDREVGALPAAGEREHERKRRGCGGREGKEGFRSPAPVRLPLPPDLD